MEFRIKKMWSPKFYEVAVLKHI